MNNVYRDLYGSPFHKGWVWSTEAQNALLFERQGQRPRAREATGKIVAFRQEDGFDYVAGDGTVSYDGKLKKALRHVFFVKPDLVVFLDEAEAPLPGHFQWMLHGQKEFDLDIHAGRLRLDREKAGVEVFYSSEAPLRLRQWTGYEPEPDHRYLKSINSPGIPPQWHVEASATVASASTFTLTVARVYRPGQRLSEPANFERREEHSSPAQRRGNSRDEIEGAGIGIREKGELKLARQQGVRIVLGAALARGWESKSVESQMEDARERRSAEPRISIEQVELAAKRSSILLDRKRIQREMENARHPRHREMLSEALRHLDEKLAKLETDPVS